YVAREGTVERRPVETGLTSRGEVEVVSGVEPGEAVVVVGNNARRDGAEVRVVKGPGGAPAGPGSRGGQARAGGAR
ncbi:MAG TPA: hypothetical protein VHG51_13400, partial [Longimicrobiaceae bacterium]|nr:hypothetical protein [Longimicrobiaceae bacterium]